MSSETRPAAPQSAACSMWRLCKLGYTHEPRLVFVVVRADPAAGGTGCTVRAVAGAVPRGVLNHDTRLIYASSRRWRPRRP